MIRYFSLVFFLFFAISASYADQSCTNCYTGIVTKIVDGDTIKIDDQYVRFSLVDAPERGEVGYTEATNFTSDKCPIGLRVIVDIDNMQIRDRYGRIIAKVICNGVNINAELLKAKHAVLYQLFCNKTEFISETWAAAACSEYSKNPITIPKSNQDTTPTKITIPKSNQDTSETNSADIIPKTNMTSIKLEHGLPQSSDINMLIYVMMFLSVVVVIVMYVILKSCNSPSFDDSLFQEIS